MQFVVPSWNTLLLTPSHHALRKPKQPHEETMYRCCDQQPQIRSQLAASTDCWTSKWMGLWKIPVPNAGLTSSLLFLWKVVCVFPSVGCRHHQQRQAFSTCPFQTLIHRTREHNKIVFVLHVYVYTSTSTYHRLQQHCHSLPALV